MNMTSIRTIPIVFALALALAACQQQPKPAPQAPVAVQPAPASKPEAPAKVAATAPAAPKPAATVAKPAAPAPVAAKPEATTSAAPKPAVSTAMAPKPASAPKPVSMPAFSTTRCMACHDIDHDKVGPAWKTVVEKYGDAATLARDFETGFKERRVANAIAKWKSKEGLMTMQYKSLIKGHEKEAAHALFETVKHGHFGSY